jgi:ubiquinone/menaquinone biosynthesis C-methylase UbiE
MTEPIRSGGTSSAATAKITARGGKPSVLSRAFGLPTGILGWLAGQLMALKNAPMNRLAVELLDVQADDRILEIGFGPGTAIQMIAEKTPAGFVAGVDPSGVLVRQASKRNRQVIRSRRVELRQGTVAHLSFEEGQFTKAFAVNSFHLWSSPKSELLEVRRVLRDGGLLLLCLRMASLRKGLFAVPGMTEEEVEAAQQLVHQAGFREVRSVQRNVGREVTCILANK